MLFVIKWCANWLTGVTCYSWWAWHCVSVDGEQQYLLLPDDSMVTSKHYYKHPTPRTHLPVVLSFFLSFIFFLSFFLCVSLHIPLLHSSSLLETPHGYWGRPNMMTSSNGNIFRVTGPLWEESTGYRWLPLTKAKDAELWCFLWSAPERDWVSNRDTSDFRCHRSHCGVTVILVVFFLQFDGTKPLVPSPLVCSFWMEIFENVMCFIYIYIYGICVFFKWQSWFPWSHWVKRGHSM